MKKLTKLLAESRAWWEKLFATKQVTKKTVTIKSAAEKHVQDLARKAESKTTGHAYVLQARDTEINKLREVVASLEKNVEVAEYERDEAKAHLQRMQIRQLKLQSAVFCVENQTSALTAALKQDRDYLLKRQDKNFQRMFVELEKVLSGQVMQSKNMTHGETKQTVDVYTAGWQTYLRELDKSATESLVAKSFLAGNAPDACPTTKPKAPGGESGDYSGSSFKYPFHVDGIALPQ